MHNLATFTLFAEKAKTLGKIRVAKVIAACFAVSFTGALIKCSKCVGPAPL